MAGCNAAYTLVGLECYKEREQPAPYIREGNGDKTGRYLGISIWVAMALQTVK